MALEAVFQNTNIFHRELPSERINVEQPPQAEKRKEGKPMKRPRGRGVVFRGPRNGRGPLSLLSHIYIYIYGMRGSTRGSMRGLDLARRGTPGDDPRIRALAKTNAAETSP